MADWAGMWGVLECVRVSGDVLVGMFRLQRAELSGGTPDYLRGIRLFCMVSGMFRFRGQGPHSRKNPSLQL